MQQRRVFISYRRIDSAYVAEDVRDRLNERLGANSVFMDIDSIPPGADFRKEIDDAIARCDVMVCVIGDQWLDDPRTNQRRIDDPRDFVRLEIESALRQNKPVLPLLVESALMPPEQLLPDSIKPVAYRNASEIRSGRDRGEQTERFISGLMGLLENVSSQPTPDQSLKRQRDTRAAKIALRIFIIAVLLSPLLVHFEEVGVMICAMVVSVFSALITRHRIYAPLTAIAPLLTACLAYNIYYSGTLVVTEKVLWLAAIAAVPAALIVFLPELKTGVRFIWQRV